MMRYFDLGLDDDDDLGALVDIRMPGDIKAEMDTVAAAIKQLDGEIQQSHTGAEFRSAWAGFVGEWRRFYAEHESWSSRLWYAAYEKTLEYRKRLGEWRAAFVQAGGHPMSPELPTPAVEKGAASHFPWLLVSGLVGGGVVAAYLLTRPRTTFNRVREVVS